MPGPDYLATQAVIFEGRVTCPNCGGKGVGRVPGWREPLVTCPLCQAEMRSPFTGLTTVTATEADVWAADTDDPDDAGPVDTVDLVAALRGAVQAARRRREDGRP